MKLGKIGTCILAIPKTIFFNFKYFSFKHALKFPVIVSNNTILMNCSGKVIIEGKIKTGIIKLGFGNVAVFDAKRQKSIWNVNGIVIFRGKANIGHGSKISVAGTLEIGDKFSISAESQIICHKHIKFGDNCLISWETLLMDTDFHKIVDKDGLIVNQDSSISIGNNVWIGCRCTILKGTSIEDNNVVAANTFLCRRMDGKNKVIGGNPAKVLRDDMYWIE